MKKLVTVLMIVLPIIFVIAIFAVTGVTKISAAIPVSGITITNKGDNGVIVLDMADYDHKLYEDDLGVEVLPYVASNREYTLIITDAQSGEKTDIVTLNAEGWFELNDVGTAKLTYMSKDGGYTDSVLINVVSSSTSVTPVIRDFGGNEYALEKADATDYRVTLTSGEYVLSTLVYPLSSVLQDISYSSSNNSAIEIDSASGEFRARFAAEATLFVSAKTDDGSTVTGSVCVTVTKAPSQSGITVNGYDNAHVSIATNATLAKIYIDAPIGTNGEDISIQSEYVNSFTVKPLDEVSHTAFEVELSLKKDRPSLMTVKVFTADSETSFELESADYDFKIYSPTNASGSGDIIAFKNKDMRLSIVSTPKNETLTYSFNIENPEIAQIISFNGNVFTLRGIACGSTKLNVTVIEKDTEGNETAIYHVSRDIYVTQRYTSLLFTETAADYGLSDTPAIAMYSYENGQKTSFIYTTGFTAYDIQNKYEPIYDDLIFECSDNSVADILQTSQGVFISPKRAGRATLSVRWKYGERFGVAPVSFTFDIIDGVRVSTYDELTLVSRRGERIVLDNDIYIGENLFDIREDGTRAPKYDEATMRNKLLAYTNEFKTTWDWTYFKNMGVNQPILRYCIEFTNDVYGNGHFINAEYVTNMYSATGNLYDFAVFRGPADFVATSVQQPKIAAVKGQDNAVFLIRKDGVCINNTVLKGCDDKSLYDNGEIDLSLLNNSGTTVEIMADATLDSCRIMNGRTAVRAYGRYGIDDTSPVNAQKEKIRVVIDSCVLQNAREFLLKIGTNRAVYDEDEGSPYLYDKNGDPYDAPNSQLCDGYANDSYFVDNYVLTDVVLKDSVLRTCGLFSIGLESRFSGPMLSGGDGLKPTLILEGWTGIAATSYPAMLHLKGDVVIADWKKLDSVDSSTLIETAASNSSSFAYLSLDIKEMLRCVTRVNAEYRKIISRINGAEYVHGGIAFYGGGKNYSILDTSEYTFEQMHTYVANLEILKRSDKTNLKLQGEYLPQAAGEGDFRFVMFDSTSKFDLNAQNSFKR